MNHDIRPAGLQPFQLQPFLDAHIRQLYPDIPVYSLTTNTSVGGEEYYKSIGFNGHIVKPVDPKELERLIMKHIPEQMMIKPGEDKSKDKEND